MYHIYHLTIDFSPWTRDEETLEGERNIRVGRHSKSDYLNGEEKIVRLVTLGLQSSGEAHQDWLARGGPGLLPPHQACRWGPEERRRLSRLASKWLQCSLPSTHQLKEMWNEKWDLFCCYSYTFLFLFLCKENKFIKLLNITSWFRMLDFSP